MEKTATASVLISILGPLREIQALTCYCVGEYCKAASLDRDGGHDVPNSETSTALNGSTKHIYSSCEAKPLAKCFSAVTQVEDIATGDLIPDR